MFALWFLALALSLPLQATGVSAFPEGVLSPDEKIRLEKESKIENRIKVYEKASTRIYSTIQAAISKNQFQSVPGDLELWTALLDASLKDIEANLKSKKKSRALIKYEIQVRKAMVAIQDSKIRAPIEQQDVFDSCLARAAAVHKRLVEILFPN